MKRMTAFFNSFGATLCILLVAGVARAGDGPIAIDVPIRTTPVDFDAEIAPILRTNCIACHNEKKDSGGLILESPRTILKGGENGPAVVPGKGAESLLLNVAAHRRKSFMPPADNKVGAKPLTPAQLGLIKLWIDQGAVAGRAVNREVRFQPLPEGYSPAFAAAVTPDGQFAVVSRGNRIFVYDLPAAKLAATLVDSSINGPSGAAHRDVVRSLAFDAAGDLMASGAFREVKLWRRPRVRQITEMPHEAPLQAVALSPDGKVAATGDERGRIRIWMIDSANERKSIAAHQDAVTGLAFSADGKELYSCSLDKSLQAWKVADGSKVGQTIVAESPLRCLVAVHRGARLVTGDAGGMAHVWDVAAFRSTSAAKPSRKIRAHEQGITALAAAGSEGDFLSGGADGFIRRWNAESETKVRELDLGQPIAALAVRPDGRRIAAAGPTFVKLFGDDNAKPIALLQGDPRLAAAVPRVEAELALTKAAVERMKQDLKSYEGLERAVKVRGEDLKKAEAELAEAKKKRDAKVAAAEKSTGDKKSSLAAVKAAAEAEIAVGVAETVVERAQAIAKRTADNLANAQKELAAREDLLRRQTAAKDAASVEAKASRPTLHAIAFSADNRRLAIASGDGAVHFHDADTGLAAESQANHRGAIRAMAFAKNGVLLTAAADRRVLTWDTSSDWRLQRTIGGVREPELLADRVLSLDFSRDGKRLATGGGVPARGGELKIWNVADGRLLRHIAGAHDDTVFGVRFSSDGQRLATVSADRFVKIFDASSGDIIRVLGGHTAHVLGVSWKADGRLLVTCGADSVLKLWDAETGALARTMKGGIYDNGRYKREVTAVSFIGDSEEILAASGDGTVRLHRVSSDNDVLKFNGAKGYQYAVAVTPNGRVVIAAGSDGVLRVWSGHDQKPKQVFAP
jgi:WD40 repeat protein